MAPEGIRSCRFQACSASASMAKRSPARLLEGALQFHTHSLYPASAHCLLPTLHYGLPKQPTKLHVMAQPSSNSDTISVPLTCLDHPSGGVMDGSHVKGVIEPTFFSVAWNAVWLGQHETPNKQTHTSRTFQFKIFRESNRGIDLTNANTHFVKLGFLDPTLVLRIFGYDLRLLWRHSTIFLK